MALELPATKLANNCYYNMFNFCTDLTKAPKLPATEITYSGATMPVRIYDLGGRLVKEVTSEAQSVVMPQHGTYIVKSGTVSLKVKL